METKSTLGPVAKAKLKVMRTAMDDAQALVVKHVRPLCRELLQGTERPNGGYMDRLCALLRRANLTPHQTRRTAEAMIQTAAIAKLAEKRYRR
jgi:hypothetical protein